jgi:hypothetical protein
MLVGCIFNTKSGSPQLGGVYVVNGGKSVGGHQQVILSPTPNITGVQQNARMGIALTSLDFNKDGYTDLVVSVPGTSFTAASCTSILAASQVLLTLLGTLHNSQTGKFTLHSNPLLSNLGFISNKIDACCSLDYSNLLLQQSHRCCYESQS